MARHKTTPPDLLYQAEPIQRLTEEGASAGDSESTADDGSPESPLGHELLYRGEGRDPDEDLLKALGGAELTMEGHLHINLDGSRATSISDELMELAAARHRIVIEWVEGNNAISSRMTNLVGSRLDTWRKRFGVHIAIDDWDGTEEGDARFHAVDDAPDIVKVCGPLFRRAIAGDVEARRLVAGFLEQVRAEGEHIQRVAEWVEHACELEDAQAMGANAAQGYVYTSERILIPSGGSGSGSSTDNDE